MVDTEIPVVDLALPEAEVAKDVFTACSTVGFFYVKNHGVEPELQKRFFAEMHKFFSLPLEEKMKICMSESRSGYRAPYREKTTTMSKKGETREAFQVGLEDLHGVLPNRRPNQWPENEQLQDFRSTMEEYFGKLRDLLETKLLYFIALSLGLQPDALAPYTVNSAFDLLLLHYFPDISNPEEGLFGAGEHTDWGLITALITDDVQGLQAKLQGQWVDVPHKENMFVINLADMMERLTHGVYKSTVHRVVTQHGKDRYSAPCFMGPNTSVMISPLPQLCKEKPAQYEPICYGDYMMANYKAYNIY